MTLTVLLDSYDDWIGSDFIPVVDPLIVSILGIISSLSNCTATPTPLKHPLNDELSIRGEVIEEVTISSKMEDSSEKAWALW